jgi:predicted RNase H-like HicB family nuclease
MSEHTQPEVFEITWRDGAYFVSIPNLYGSHTVVELDPMLDMIERLMSPHFEVREDAGAEAIRLLRAHGRLGQPVVSPEEGAELESGWV